MPVGPLSDRHLVELKTWLQPWFPPDRVYWDTFGDEDFPVLTWSDSCIDGGSAVTGYTVYRGTVSGGESFLADVSAGTLTYTDADVLPGTTYFYTVTATNSTGESDPSDEVVVVVA